MQEKINRLAFSSTQINRIGNMTPKQQETLAIISGALAIDCLYIFSDFEGEHPLGDYYCDIATSLRKKTNITEDKYHYLCGKLGLMELDEIIDFIIKIT
ncbi:hypothetical protein [Sulfurimonas sp.]|uniref:hypothetical protein n=1 Tax=Sulfurimonas sp. TaxID=2022749 RepID=UPI0025DD24BE|nr:hypothetical protein [Sulfurimonas sp.]